METRLDTYWMFINFTVDFRHIIDKNTSIQEVHKKEWELLNITGSYCTDDRRQITIASFNEIVIVPKMTDCYQKKKGANKIKWKTNFKGTSGGDLCCHMDQDTTGIKFHIQLLSSMLHSSGLLQLPNQYWDWQNECIHFKDESPHMKVWIWQHY